MSYIILVHALLALGAIHFPVAQMALLMSPQPVLSLKLLYYYCKIFLEQKISFIKHTNRLEYCNLVAKRTFLLWAVQTLLVVI